MVVLENHRVRSWSIRCSPREPAETKQKSAVSAPYLGTCMTTPSSYVRDEFRWQSVDCSHEVKNKTLQHLPWNWTPF